MRPRAGLVGLRSPSIPRQCAERTRCGPACCAESGKLIPALVRRKATETGECGNSGAGLPHAVMLDRQRSRSHARRGKTAADALGAQRRAAVHGDGRDGGGGAHRGRRRPGDSHGGRPAGGAGAGDRDRGGARRARSGRCATPRRSAFPRCAPASRATTRERHGVTVDPARVIVTTGSSAGFILAFLALFEPGDRVAVAVPGYPPYRHILKALGCEPVLIETTAETRWAITPDMLLAAHRRAPLKGVLVASPANPTGTMMTAEALRDLIAAAEARRHPLHLRRDLSRARLRVSRRDRGALVRRCARSSIRSRNISA